MSKFEPTKEEAELYGKPPRCAYCNSIMIGQKKLDNSDRDQDYYVFSYKCTKCGSKGPKARAKAYRGQEVEDATAWESRKLAHGPSMEKQGLKKEFLEFMDTSNQEYGEIFEKNRVLIKERDKLQARLIAGIKSKVIPNELVETLAKSVQAGDLFGQVEKALAPLSNCETCSESYDCNRKRQHKARRLPVSANIVHDTSPITLCSQHPELKGKLS